MASMAAPMQPAVMPNSCTGYRLNVVPGWPTLAWPGLQAALMPVPQTCLIQVSQSHERTPVNAQLYAFPSV